MSVSDSKYRMSFADDFMISADNAQCQANIWTVKDDDKLLATWKDPSGKSDALKLVEVEDDDARRVLSADHDIPC